MSVERAELRGVSTNNLKRISVTIPHNGLTLIVGPSGSGKSSLAYDTLAQIGQHEYLSMCADELSDAEYKLDSYSGMLATVPLKQSCSNTNTHSTIGTYFGLNRELVLVYSALLGVRDDFFVLNKPSNLCPVCHGLGVVRAIDPNKIIDYGIPLRKNPIKCWNRHKDFFAQMIELFCQSEKIDSDKTFRQLTQDERETILRGESTIKFSVRYKKVNRMASRTSRYHGVLTGVPMLPQVSVSDSFYSDVVCLECNGHRYSRDHEAQKVEGVSIGALMTMPFSDLERFLVLLFGKHRRSSWSGAIQHVLSFVSKANELHLGHLNLNRGIPTLSGGELQRLRLSQIFNTQLTNLMVILDEPLAGVSPDEKKVIFGNVVSLKRKHTVVVVDHGDRFRSVAEHVIALGFGGGDAGGYLINANDYFSKQRLVSASHPKPTENRIHIEVFNDIYGYRGAELDLEMGGMTLLTGRSGVGKSILLREFLPLRFDSYGYISQKHLIAGKQSSVATILDVSMPLAELFAKKFSKPKQFFSKQIGCPGACPVCNGYGMLEFKETGSIQVICPECGGSGFLQQLKKLTLNGLSIPDIWNMTISGAVDFFDAFHLAASATLKAADQLFLGHLRLEQKTASLSGGENIRIKLLKAKRMQSDILGIDEPFRGLDRLEQSRVIDYLVGLVKSGKTLLVVDHTEGIEDYFTSRYEVVSENGMLKTRAS